LVARAGFEPATFGL